MAKFVRVFSLFAATGAAVFAIAGLGCRAPKQSGEQPPLPPPAYVPDEASARMSPTSLPGNSKTPFISPDPVSQQAGYAGLKQALDKVQTERALPENPVAPTPQQLATQQRSSKQLAAQPPFSKPPQTKLRAINLAGGKSVAQALAQLDALPNVDPQTKQDLREQLLKADPQESAILLGYLQYVIQKQGTATPQVAAKVEPDAAVLPDTPIAKPAIPREIPAIADDPPHRLTPEPVREAAVRSPAASPGTTIPSKASPHVVPVVHTQPISPPKLAEAAMEASPRVSPTQTPGQLAGDPKKLEESDNWRQKLEAAIVSMQAASAQPNASPTEKASIEAALRLLQVAAQKKQDAVRGVSGWNSGQQQFWSHQMHALATWLDAESLPREDRRAAVALRQLREGAGELATLSTLDVSNLAFCSEVLSFGRYTEFKTREFKPDQEVLLYCEIDNFTSDKTAQGYETSLQGSYQIVDSTGRRLAEHTFQTEIEVCRNRRRDYFVPFRLWVPKTLSPGSYVLQLSVEDLKGKKFGQASIDFTVK